MSRHPIQPLVLDDHGVLRFKANAIVRHLLDNGGIDMNALARMDFSQDDRIQFAQLIGYSQDGFGTLSYVDDETFETATRVKDGAAEAEARIDMLRTRLESLKAQLREPIAELYGISEYDLP